MVSLLYKGKAEEADKERQAFFADFNLDQIIKAITDDWDLDIKDLYFQVPAKKETEDYRRAIFQDIKKDSVHDSMSVFLDCMRQQEECVANKDKLDEKRQQQVWFIREVSCYVKAVEALQACLQTRAYQSEGFSLFHEWLAGYMDSGEYIELKSEVTALEQELRGFRILLSYENGKFTVEDASTEEASYEDFLKECFPENQKALKSPFLGSGEWAELEERAIGLFAKKHKEFFHRAEQFWKQYQTYQKEEIKALPKELSYYMAYLRFMKKLEQTGLHFCIPATGGETLAAKGLYDLALAYVSLEKEKEVVPNDFELFPEEKFIVLTGPNQGGKTTFARSLGQLVYFTKMGLDVPAAEAVVPYYTEILTHFSVEESVETGRGKLLEELSRLKPMMQQEKKGAFVIINELFTTAANADACVMGRKVLEYFIDNGCKGIYVTHLNELSTAHPMVVSFRATTDEENRQTYKVARQQAVETAGAILQVEKYHLTYQQIKERFS